MLPLYRTDDRELRRSSRSPAAAARVLGSARPRRKTQCGLNFSGDIMYTQYFDALFITFRTAVYGSIGFDAEFE